jgi:hypothetical protein
MSVAGLHRVKWQDYRRMMNWVGIGNSGQNQIQVFSGATEDNHGKPRSVYPVSRLRFDASISRRRISSLTSSPHRSNAIMKPVIRLCMCLSHCSRSFNWSSMASWPIHISNSYCLPCAFCDVHSYVEQSNYYVMSTRHACLKHLKRHGNYS